MSNSVEWSYTSTPSCPPPKGMECNGYPCSRFQCGGFPEPPPSPPRLRRSDTSSNYAKPVYDSGYDRWLLEDNFSRISAIESKLQQMQLELITLRESTSALMARIAAPSSPVSRQVASPRIADARSPHYPFSCATSEIMENFGM
jgi:hypothetical protein